MASFAAGECVSCIPKKEQGASELRLGDSCRTSSVHSKFSLHYSLTGID